MTNLNHSSQNKFKVEFNNLPNVTFMLRTFTVPSVSLTGEAQYSTPFGEVPVPGNKILYDPFTITFSLDENWLNWEEVHNWMLGFGDFRGPVIESAEPANAVVYPLDNDFKIFTTLDLVDCFPINLESPTYTYQLQQQEDIEISATFNLAGMMFNRT